MDRELWMDDARMDVDGWMDGEMMDGWMDSWIHRDMDGWMER